MAQTTPAPIPSDRCTNQLADCEAVLDAADFAINKQAETISALDRQNQLLQKSLMDASRELAEKEAWYKRPEVLAPTAFVLGVVVGVLAGGKR